MARTSQRQQPRKATRSRRSRSTKRSNASTPTSRIPAASRSRKHFQLASELLSRSLKPVRRHEPLQEAVVEGVSMWPLLRPGFRISYKAVHPEELSPGDLLVLESSGRKGERLWRVHRLLGRVGPYFVEAGDNSYSAALVRAEDILGRVEKVRDWKGKRVKLGPVSRRVDRRFQILLGAAHAFMFAHECKDRLLGGRRSLLLWRASQVYRAGIGALGLKVPAIMPAV